MTCNITRDIFMRTCSMVMLTYDLYPQFLLPFTVFFKMIYNYMRDFRMNKCEMSSCKKLHVHITNSQSHVYHIRSAELCIDLLT